MSNETIDLHLVHPDLCEEFGGRLEGPGCHYEADVFFLSLLLFILTFTVAYALKATRNGRFFPAKVGIVFLSGACVHFSVVCQVYTYLYYINLG